MKPARRWSRIDVEAAIMLYISGWSLFTIGAVLGRSWKPVWDLLTRPDIGERIIKIRGW